MPHDLHHVTKAVALTLEQIAAQKGAAHRDRQRQLEWAVVIACRIRCGGATRRPPRCASWGRAKGVRTWSRENPATAFPPGSVQPGSHMPPRWREGDSNPRSPVRILTQTRSNGDVQHPCAATRMTIGTRIGSAIGGFAPVVAAAVQGEGPNAWVPAAPLNSPIGVVASIAAWTAHETQHSDARLRVNRRLPTLTPPNSALSDWNNDKIGEARRI